MIVVNETTSVIEAEHTHLLCHDLIVVSIAALFLGVYDLLLLYPLVLLLLATSPLFLHCDQRPCLEFILLGGQDFWLDDRLRGSDLGFYFSIEFKTFFVDGTLKDSLDDPIFWDVTEGSVDDFGVDDAFFLLGVVVRTGTLPAAFDVALQCFVIAGVVLLFFPAVTHVTVHSNFAAAVVIRYGDVVFGLPVVARLGRGMYTIGS